MSEDRWKQIHRDYQKAGWIEKPSIFAKQAVNYFPGAGKILELGAGFGQDSRFFADKGYAVTSTDTGDLAISENKKRSSSEKIQIRRLNIREKFPFDKESFDVVYAHLSLHYFDDETTQDIFDEIYRVLKKGGIFAFFTNSTDDPEFNTGKKIEDHYFEIDRLKKRYFNAKEALKYAHRFNAIVCDNKGETYKDSAKGIHNLIRYIGSK